ncbi:hypothetical protein FA13DRAFT_1035495 [Coprinellus micaceus]|uniref:Uncharacterized protein n=1 Tax=Coprinellus micaceus TaxID=71717 RepID=A0A4Y7RMB5_COPMI|nr:hypothetical protein FA13DRAFT_1035495 [Coprinellus micaceus]
MPLPTHFSRNARSSSVWRLSRWVQIRIMVAAAHSTGVDPVLVSVSISRLRMVAQFRPLHISLDFSWVFDCVICLWPRWKPIAGTSLVAFHTVAPGKTRLGGALIPFAAPHDLDARSVHWLELNDA